MKNKPTKLLLLIAVSTAVAFILMPSPLEFIADYTVVLRTELPKGCECVYQRLSATGKDRTIYSLSMVVQGKTNLLTALVGELGLEKTNQRQFPESRYINKNRFKDWYPVKESTINELLLFRKGGGGDPDEFGDLCSEAEIIDNKLYLVRIGTVESLKKSLKEKGGIYKFVSYL